VHSRLSELAQMATVHRLNNGPLDLDGLSASSHLSDGHAMQQ
jgi:hypothetical protein